MRPCTRHAQQRGRHDQVSARQHLATARLCSLDQAPRGAAQAAHPYTLAERPQSRSLVQELAQALACLPDGVRTATTGGPSIPALLAGLVQGLPGTDSPGQGAGLAFIGKVSGWLVLLLSIWQSSPAAALIFLNWTGK